VKGVKGDLLYQKRIFTEISRKVKLKGGTFKMVGQKKKVSSKKQLWGGRERLRE